jgi:aminoglycoside 6'-N-acetyltransferase
VPELGFRPITPTDLPLLRAWMERPHWREWWGDPEVECGYVRDMIEGHDSTEPYFICLDGVPAGYIQVWYVADQRIEPWLTEAPWLKDLPDDAVGVDLSLAEAGALSQGIGTAALKAFVALLRARGHDEIWIDPAPENLRAVRAYHKAGFRVAERLRGTTGDSLLMRFEEGGA